MSVSEVVLFICSNSHACAPCVQAVQYLRLPIKIVRLDHKKMRDAVSKGKYFKVNDVPTLLVVYNDGNIQLFVGREKVMSWIDQLASMRSKEEIQIETPSPPKKKKKSKSKSKIKAKKPKQRSTPVEMDNSEDEMEIMYIEEDPPQMSQHQQKGPAPPTRGLMTGPESNMNKGPSAIMAEAARLRAQSGLSEDSGSGGGRNPNRKFYAPTGF